jgi:hypothetical protein
VVFHADYAAIPLTRLRGSTRRRIIDYLPKRGRPTDGRAAEALEWTPGE